MLPVKHGLIGMLHKQGRLVRVPMRRSVKGLNEVAEVCRKARRPMPQDLELTHEVLGDSY